MRHIAKPVNADASLHRAMLLPCGTVPFIGLALLCISMPSLGVASRCPAAAFQNIAALIYALPSPSFALPSPSFALPSPSFALPSPSFAVRRSALPSQGLAELSLYQAEQCHTPPSPRHTVLCFAAALERAALPLPCSVKRRVAVAKHGSSPPYHRFARRRRAPACLSTALQCRCSASPSPGFALPCRRLAWHVPAVTLLSFSWLSLSQGPRREAMISARGCWP